MRENTNWKGLVKKGTAILCAEPFVHILNQRLRSQHCDTCLKQKERLLRCSRCQFMHYCDDNCQRKDWSLHRYECQPLRSIQPKVPPDLVRLLARIIFKLKNGGDKEIGTISSSWVRRFTDLMSHSSEIKEDTQRCEHFLSVCGVLKEYLVGEVLPNPAELMTMFGRIVINSFNIVDGELLVIGTGIYLAPSIINHSCAPNAVAIFDGPVLTIRTITDVQDFHWDKVRICYIDTLQTTMERQAELQKMYYFLCDCLYCADRERDAKMRSMKCSSCPSPVPVPMFLVSSPTEDIMCPRCQHIIPANEVVSYLDDEAFSKFQINEMKNKETNYLDCSRLCLQRQSHYFHHLNIFHIRALDSAFDAAISLQYWEEAHQYGLESLEAYRSYLSENHPLLGLQLLRLGKLEMELNKLSFAASHLQEAFHILMISHGEEHPLFKHELLPLVHQSQALSRDNSFVNTEFHTDHG